MPSRKPGRTHGDIVAAASALLAERGPSGITVHAVAEQAGVAVQTIYNQFGSRSGLLAVVAERAFSANRRYMDPAYAAPGTPLHRIGAAADAYTEFALAHPREFRLLVEPPDHPAVVGAIESLVSEQNGKLATAIADGVADGSLSPGLDPTATATVLWAAINGVLLLAAKEPARSADEVRGLVAEFKRLCVPGLTPGSF